MEMNNRKLEAWHWWAIALGALCLFAAVMYFTGCNKNDPKTREGDVSGLYSGLDEMGIPRHEALFKFKATTPGGVLINSTVAVPAEPQARLDRAMEAIIRTYRAKFPDWKNGFDRSKDFNAIFVEPRVINVETTPGAPSLVTRGGQTCGTAIGERRSAWPHTYIVMPHQQNQQWQYLDYIENCAYNEWEHVVQSKNSLDEYNRNLANNDIHPHHTPLPAAP